MQIVGLIGHPVGHSISPAFQQAAFDALGLPVRYEAWDTPPGSLPTTIARLRAPDYLGANVTIPHKQAVISLLDAVDPFARAIAAVNTIVRQEDGTLVGYNTDVEGFTRSLRDEAGTDLGGCRVVLLGAGGAARAVAAAAAVQRAAILTICARRIEQAEDLRDMLVRTELLGPGMETRVLGLTCPGEMLGRTIETCDVLVNATPVGMAGHPSPASTVIDPAWISPRTLVVDLIYNPPITPLLAAAAARSARTLNGLGMLIYQGAAAFERWTGRAAPIEVMRARAREALHG
ncbi:MAG: shikimate dehydrogenase [Chloroflexi bacterium]|nr:shikimate dehydrogenase [Chloroflexota bacterium]